MTRYYKRSLLLIEFDDQKSFNFKGKYWGNSFLGPTSSSGRHNVLVQLVVLTIHFPLLRLVWSPSPHFSAELFEYLKEGKEEPTAQHVVGKSGQQLPAEVVTDKYDIECKEFLLCLPGINMTNVYAIMNRCKSITHLLDFGVEELTEILSNSTAAEQLYSCLHSKLVDNSNPDLDKNKKRFKRFANKRKI